MTIFANSLSSFTFAGNQSINQSINQEFISDHLDL